MGMKQPLTKEEFLEILKEREEFWKNAEIINENNRAEIIETIWMLSPIINFMLLMVIIRLLF